MAFVKNHLKLLHCHKLIVTIDPLRTFASTCDPYGTHADSGVKGLHVSMRMVYRMSINVH